MRVADIRTLPRFFDRYILQAGDDDLLTGLRRSPGLEGQVDLAQLRILGDHAYAAGKWTVVSVLQHLIDTERIMSFRALWFARGGPSPLPGFDEELFARTAVVASRSVDDLLAEYRTVREASIRLFASFDDAALTRTGVCCDTEIQPVALGFVLVGHQRHHAQVLRQRYLGLA